MATRYHDLELADLRLDGVNPRHPPEEGQRETIAALLREGGTKLAELTRDIAEHGLSPMEPLVVTPLDKNSYVTLEGNRRVAALKLLVNPTLADGHPTAKAFREIAKVANYRPGLVRCCIVDSRSDADHWLRLRHTGENKGAGVVPWSAEQVQRFSGRGGSQAHAALSFADLMATTYGSNGQLQSDLVKVRQTKLTTLGRLVQDPQFRRRIGLVRDKDGFRSHYPAEVIEATIARLLTDLAGTLSVSALKSKEQRATYAAGLPAPDASAYTVHAAALTPVSAKPRSKRPKPSAPAKYLFLGISLSKLNPRVLAVFSELRQLEVERYPNATGVLLRVVLELAVNDFLIQKGIRLGQELKDQVRRALKELDPKEKDARFQPVRAGLADGTSVLAVRTIHAFVHNPHYHPTAAELRSIASNYSAFLQGLDAALP